VVLSGEAPPAVLKNTRQAIQEALPDQLQHLLRDQVDPVFIGAIGAAHRARKHVHDPELLNIQSDHEHFRHFPDLDHDEL
jgi:hypothetical protein